MRLRHRAWAFLLALGVSACANIPLGTPQPTLQSIENLRTARIGPLALGDFRLAADADPAFDKPMNVRSNHVSPANGGSYSQYLKDTFRIELIAAGKYDENSATVVSAQLTDNRLDGSLAAVNQAHIGARIALNRNGRVIFEKQYDADSSWASTFLGAVAIPAAVNEYTALFRKFVDRVLTDQAFEAAAQPAP